MLSWCSRLCYGVGHFYNDLAASMWFTYLIVYLQFVLCFDASVAGFVLLVGQIADAVATPLLGYETDNITYLSFCKKYGRRKFLHLAGTLCVLFSFPFIFIECPGSHGADQWAMVVYLVPLVIIFQVGWAAVQVSHLALIPAITDDSSERDLLNVLRNAFDAVADVTVFIIAWITFVTVISGPADPFSIATDDRTKFMIIVLILTCIGCVFSTIFHLGVKEKTAPSLSCSTETALSSAILAHQNTLTWRQWLKEKQFYQMAVLYTLARLFQNFCSVFIPLYLQESLKARQDFMAKIPLLIHITGFIASIMANYLIKIFGKKITLIIGATVGVGGCVWIGFGEGEAFCSEYIYIVSTLLGIGSNILVVCSLTLIPDLIGTSVESGTFVYGTMSFFDKLANGIGILIVQYMHKLVCEDCDWYYRHVMSYGLGGIGVAFVVVLLTLFRIKFGERNRTAKGAKKHERKEENGSVVLGNGYSKCGYDDDEIQPLLGRN